MIRIFVCGDVMTGRGIDQVLPHPGDPVIHESYMRSANGYVALAEKATGPIPRKAGFDYVWGDALEVWNSLQPQARIINLETAITTRSEYEPKGINYRMHPSNVPCIAAARPDCCVLANNHVLDWGRDGLIETLDSLHGAGLATAGAGRDAEAARTPASIALPDGTRLHVFAYGHPSSGIPVVWAATSRTPGINLLEDLSDAEVARVADDVVRHKREGDLAVVSLHWGGNWGYAIPAQQRRFARRLVDMEAVDLVHGHSSHHVKGIEIYRGKPILYGCGDFLNDYEGIGGHESYRDDLTLMYFVGFDPVSGRLQELCMVPMQIRHFRLQHASAADTRWMCELLNREGGETGTHAILDAGVLQLQWRNS